MLYQTRFSFLPDERPRHFRSCALPYRALPLLGTPKEAPCGGIYAVLDLEDWWDATVLRWGIGVSRHKDFNKFYGRRTENGVTIWLHKWVCERAHGPPPTSDHRIADHLDGNSLNCRHSNMRWATDQTNSQNKYGFAALQKVLL